MLAVIAISIVIAAIYILILFYEWSSQRKDESPRNHIEDSFGIARRPTNTIQKLSNFGTSNPVWAAVAMVGAVVLTSHISAKVVIGLAVVALTFEVWHVRFFESPVPRILSSIIALTIFSGLAIVTWSYIKPASLEEEFSNAIRNHYPWLAEPPKPNPLAMPQPQSSHVVAKTNSCLISPNSGVGNPAWTNVCDSQIADWIIQESVKVMDVATRIDEDKSLDNPGGAGGARRMVFHWTFERCCKDDFIQYRSEALARLGPLERNDKESDRFQYLYTSFPTISFDTISPFDMQNYLPLYNDIGVRLQEHVNGFEGKR